MFGLSCVHFRGNVYGKIGFMNYEAPKIVSIQLITSVGEPFTRFQVPLIIHYGDSFTLLSDKHGKIFITRELLIKSLLSKGRNDYGKFSDVMITIYSSSPVMSAIKSHIDPARALSDFELEIYGNMTTMIKAYSPPPEDLVTVTKWVRFNNKEDVVKLKLPVIILKEIGSFDRRIQFKIIEAAKEKLIRWAKSQDIPLFNVEFVVPFVDNDFGLFVWLFYTLNQMVEELSMIGISEKVKSEFINILFELGYPKILIQFVEFEFDSDENVQKNYEGSYFYRLR
jgi:hypothetical protein